MYHYVTVILKEIRILVAGNEMYKNINKIQEEIIQDNLEYNVSNFSTEVKIKVCQYNTGSQN